MKEIIIGLLDAITILMAFAFCKAISKSDKILENLNELNIDVK